MGPAAPSHQRRKMAVLVNHHNAARPKMMPSLTSEGKEITADGKCRDESGEDHEARLDAGEAVNDAWATIAAQVLLHFADFAAGRVDFLGEADKEFAVSDAKAFVLIGMRQGRPSIPCRVEKVYPCASAGCR